MIPKAGTGCAEIGNGSGKRPASKRDRRPSFPFPLVTFLGFWAGFESATNLGIRAIPAGGLTSENRVKMIARLRPEVLCCTPTYGLRLAEIADDARSLGVQKLIVAGEPGGSLPEVRARLNEAWDAEVIDHQWHDRSGAV